MKKLQAPNPFFLDANGDALNAGYVFVGTAGANAETNQITVYWDEAGTQPAAQPLRTANGYIVNGASRARAFVNADDFSMIVKNRHGVVIDYTDTQVGLDWNSISTAMTPVVQSENLDDARAEMGAAKSGVNNDITALNSLSAVPTVVSEAIGEIFALHGTRSSVVTSGTRIYFNNVPRDVKNWWSSGTSIITTTSANVVLWVGVTVTNSGASSLSTNIRVSSNGSLLSSRPVTVPSGSSVGVDVVYVGPINSGVLDIFGTTTWSASALNIVANDARIGILVFP